MTNENYKNEVLTRYSFYLDKALGKTDLRDSLVSGLERAFEEAEREPLSPIAKSIFTLEALKGFEETNSSNYRKGISIRAFNKIHFHFNGSRFGPEETEMTYENVARELDNFTTYRDFGEKAREFVQDFLKYSGINL